MSAHSSGYLEAWLAPLLPILARSDVSDVYINRTGEIWIETLGGVQERHAVPELDDERLWRIAQQVAMASSQAISRSHPILSAALPDGARIQIVAPPAAQGSLAIAIRRHIALDRRLSDYADEGLFDRTKIHGAQQERPKPKLSQQDRTGDTAELLCAAVRDKKNILVSGGTATGKTTFMNALMREFDPAERIITIEDAQELRVEQANAVRLLAVKGDQGEAHVNTNDLLEAALRMRPDRIILGEIRGSEAYTFLRAVNTGHPGSISSIHANDPHGALEQLAMIIAQSGTNLSRQDVLEYVVSVIDLVVQLDRTKGTRVVSQIMYTRAAA